MNKNKGCRCGRSVKPVIQKRTTRREPMALDWGKVASTGGDVLKGVIRPTVRVSPTPEMWYFAGATVLAMTLGGLIVAKSIR